MRAYEESMYWMTNEEWFKVNKEMDCYELTEDAPPRAIRSFKLWNGELKPKRSLKQLFESFVFNYIL